MGETAREAHRRRVAEEAAAKAKAAEQAAAETETAEQTKSGKKK